MIQHHVTPVQGTGTAFWWESPPRIVVGITHAQTCLVLGGRLRALQSAGFQVTLLSSPGPLLDRLEREEHVEVLRLPMARKIAPLADLRALWSLWRHLRRIRPDAVEFSTPKAGLLGMLASVLAGVPRRVYFMRGLKLESATGLKRAILWLAERTAAACAHVVLCNSPSLRQRVHALRIASAAKLQILGEGSTHGVDIEQFRPGSSNVRRRFGISEGSQVIGYVGRLTRDKGIPELIAAFDRILQTMPQTYLLLVGWFDEAEDALDHELRQRIAHHPHVVCTGFVADPAPCYRAMDLLVLPSLREGFPNVVLEASATGIPVITTLSTGARDSVVHNETGLLVSPGDCEAIVEATLSLLQNPEKRRRLGEKARARVAEFFPSHRLKQLTAAFYANLLHREDLPALCKPSSMDWDAPLR